MLVKARDKCRSGCSLEVAWFFKTAILRGHPYIWRHIDAQMFSKHCFLDQFAEDVAGQDVGFLDAGGLIAGDADAAVDGFR